MMEYNSSEEKLFRFLNWQVYKDSKKVFKRILKIVGKMPKEFRFELGSQIIRSANSIILNIAEGSGKSSDKELNRFFNIALGSINETVANLDVLRENNFINSEEFDTLFLEIKGVSKQLGGFKKKLNN